MEDDYDPELDLDGLLDSTITQFERAARDRYEMAEDGQFAWRFSARIVELMEPSVADMSNATYAEMWRSIPEALEKIGLREDVQFALQARLARKLADSQGMSERFFELAKLIASAQPPEHVTRFLRRVSRCYILGLSPECLVMCRASLENAVNAKYAMHRTSYPADSSGRQTMKLRLESAAQRNWLDAGLATRAFQVVWGRGNKAAHADPDAVGNALEAITATMEAIGQLHAPPPNWDS
jgi:hypothetical protein